jgi:hypothetical protein
MTTKINNYFAIDKEEALKAAVLIAKEKNFKLYFGKSQNTVHVSQVRDTVEKVDCEIFPDGTIVFSDGTKIIL